MINFTVNPTLEYVFEWYLLGVGFIVLPLNIFTLYLVYSKTPKHSGTYRYFVLHIQMWSTLVDINFGFLFMPMPLFPLTGGYCYGLLCKAGLPMHYLLVLTYVVFCGTFLSLGLSIFYRHQLILPRDHWLRLGAPARSILFIIFSVALQSPAITLLIAPIGKSKNVEYLKQNHPAMLWLTKKDSWVVYEPYEFPLSWMCLEVLALSITLPVLYFIIAMHIYHGIAEAKFMSMKTRNLHRHIVMVLIGQVIVFCIFLIVPLPVFILSVYTEQIGHEITLLLFAMLLLYSWTHSLVLIATTPPYRAVFSKTFLSRISKFSYRTSEGEERKTLHPVTKESSNEGTPL